MLRLTLLALALLTATPALAQKLEAMPDLAVSIADRTRYQQCLEAAEKDPPETFELAMQWRDTTGSNAAKHCVAVALFYLGQPAVAGDRLEQLGIEMRAATPEIRARILSQAATAWLASGHGERAYGAVTTAIGMAPRLPDLYVDRSIVLAQAANYWEAIDDLNKAVDIDPRYGMAFAFRAAAYRYVDSLDLALEDAEQAVKLTPDLPEGWLERGIIRRLKGNINGARADWLRVLVIEPDGLAGDTARANIERLELNLGEQPANLPGRGSRR
jgi:tetratricopeptide (TPR) repeat protein